MQNNLLLSKSHIVIYGKDLTLRAINETDLEDIRIWRNKDNIRLSFINNSIITSEAQEKWYQLYKEKCDDIMFVIIHNESKKKIGCVSLYDINYTSCTAEFGRLMIGDETYRGYNYGVLSTEMIINFAINDLKLKEIILYVFKDNLPAIKTYTKAGFMKINCYEDEYKLLKMSYPTVS